MSIALTAEETASIRADMAAAFAGAPAFLVGEMVTPDGTGGEVQGSTGRRSISIGISNRQATEGLDEGGRARTIVTATGKVSISELEHLHEGDFIELETDDAREFEHWEIKAIVVGQSLVSLSLTRKEDA